MTWPKIYLRGSKWSHSRGKDFVKNIKNTILNIFIYLIKYKM